MMCKAVVITGNCKQ